MAYFWKSKFFVHSYFFVSNYFFFLEICNKNARKAFINEKWSYTSSRIKIVWHWNLVRRSRWWVGVWFQSRHDFLVFENKFIKVIFTECDNNSENCGKKYDTSFPDKNVLENSASFITIIVAPFRANTEFCNVNI